MNSNDETVSISNFDMESAVKIQTGKLTSIKKTIQKMEEDLNSGELNGYHSAAIAIEVLSNYLGCKNRFVRDCRDFMKLVIQEIDKEKSEKQSHH